MLILADMDGVIANFDKAVLDEFITRHPGTPYLPLEKRRTFYIADDYPKESRKYLEEIYFRKGFFRNLPPIEGSIEALEDMATRHEVFICSSPLLQNPYCIEEKMAWIHEHMGTYWVDHTILTKDKTIITGDILIDDKPSISGLHRPSWEHVLYDQPYNRTIKDKRRITWSNWRSIIEARYE